MTAAKRELRRVSFQYPKEYAALSVEITLRETVRDSQERTDMAALIASWLAKVNESPEAPISGVTIGQILREIGAHGH